MKLSNKKENNYVTLKWICKRSKKFIPLIMLLCVVCIFDSLTSIALALISKNVLDVATGSMQGRILEQAIQLFAVIFAQLLLIFLHSFFNTYISAKLNISIRDYLFSVVCKKKYSYISKYHSGDILNRFTSDVDIVVASVVAVIPNICSMIAKIVGGISALLVLDAKIAFIILLLGILVPAFGRIINKRYKKVHKIGQETEGKTRAFIQECLENIVVVKTFVSEKPFSNKLGQLMLENYRTKMKRMGLSLATHISLYAFFTIGYYAILVWGAGQISTGTITYGTLMAFLQLVSQLRAPLQNISGIVPQYYSAIASAERLMEVEDGEDDKPSAAMDKLSEIEHNFKYLQINDITFAYKDEIILKNSNFTAEKGKITAITGESGSGKSTIFKIILGLYEPQNGDITINGSTKLDTSLRGLFAYVPQGNMVLSGTIRENITLCNEDVSEEELIKAAKAAEIYDLIMLLPEGFDTLITERGGGLSEGQIQRISLARALLTDAPVLLLDEATSALDEPTETRVLSNIRAMNDKTILFVTHRNTSLKVCDKIIRVEDKKFNVIKE